MKQQYNLAPTQKWIAFGGSYPGSLAAWAREKYPDLIYGSISSSGPLLAKVDFTGKEMKLQEFKNYNTYSILYRIFRCSKGLLKKL